MDKSKLTCVSGYWKVKNKHGNNFDNWFKNTLSIHCPYVFFGDNETIKMVKSYRGKLPTYYIELDIQDFITYKYKNKMRTHRCHCPSIELNLIWNEKIFLIQKASIINPFSSDFFCWIDAGICTYRDTLPPQILFPNENRLSLLPKDKFIYSSSMDYDEGKVKKTKYYHHISGTTYILHKNIIHNFCTLYESYLDPLLHFNNIWTDQVLLTHIYKDRPDLFYKLCDGYGSIIPSLF